MPIVAIVGLIVAGTAVPARAEVDAEQVRQSIDRGVRYLRNAQNERGGWTEYEILPGGLSGLCALALLNAGTPPDDPQMRMALNYLRRFQPTMTYSVALQTMVLCAAEPEKDLLLIRRNAKWLEDQQIRTGEKRGTWSYGTQGNGDNSNTQFAILALHEAERVGVSVSTQTWRLASEYWQRTQNPDGSWGYQPGTAGTGSMTSAGVGSLIMAAEKLSPGDATVDGDTVRCCGEQADNDAVRRGIAWIERNFSVRRNPGNNNYLFYYLYGVERIGRLSNQRLLGNHDWYREGAEYLVHVQKELGAGEWTGLGHAESDPLVATSLALLFLAKGRRPVLLAKAQFDDAGDWNRHRHDAAALTSFAEQRWQRELTWQAIDGRTATPDDLIEAPVLFLSGNQSPQLTDQEVVNLREYINRGGFLFAENCCPGGTFDAGFRRLMQRVFPEPEYELTLLPPDHPVWSAEEPVPANFVQPLWGVDVGCRTSVVYSPEPLGCYWELDRVGRKLKYPPAVEAEVAAKKIIGLNVLAYATNREVKYKLEMPRSVAGGRPEDQMERARIYIAKVRHGGSWNAAPGALLNLLRSVSQETGLRMSFDRRELALSDPELFRYHMVFMHGRNRFRLTDAERKQLRTFVERGGLVLADSVCASDEFSAAFRHEMALAFPDHPLQPVAVDDTLFSTEYGGFDLRQVARRDPRRRQGGGLQAPARQVEPELEGIRLGDRWGVLFSPYDLSCALERHSSIECAGYTPEDAAKIGLNVVLYSLH